MNSKDKEQFRTNQFITDGGLETTLIFENNIDLPEFAAFPLIFDEQGRKILQEYYHPYLDLAVNNSLGFILESPTWRASKAWGKKLGYSAQQLKEANHQSIALLKDLKDTYKSRMNPIFISGCIGPQGDGYHIDTKMTIPEAKEYHSTQIQSLKEAGADIVSAFTMTYVEEAIGITHAAKEHEIPVVIAFTVETDGRLPSGQPLGSAIIETDKATENEPLYYMVNCAHPDHFERVLHNSQDWKSRIRGIRANASCKSHTELDESTELDRGNPEQLAEDYSRLQKILTNLNIYGGCCGTNHEHVQAICSSIALHHPA